MKQLVPATLAFTAEGVPFSHTFGDVYHSTDGGPGQARHVFLGGNGLPERWRGENIFTIVETGFGLGLNFLATWQAFRDDPHRPTTLHYVAVEKHPFSASDLKTLHKQCPEFAPLSEELIQRWPSLIGGFHRLHLDANRIALTLLFGDALDLLPQLEAKADAFFLDGFAPAKNADLWSPSLCSQLARLAAPKATLATYTVASDVRNALAMAGFVTEKIPGFGRKREMLRGSRNGDIHSARPNRPSHAIVIGAGLSGTYCAERLAARGWTVDVIERHSLPAQEASGNPSGVLRPILNMIETAHARLSRTAFLYAIRYLQTLNKEGHRIQWGSDGVLHLAPKAGEEKRLARIIERHAFPPDLVRFVDADEATRLAGSTVNSDGCWFPEGAWVNPPSLCKANLDRHGTNVICHMSTNALRLKRTNDDQWRVCGDDDSVIAEAPVLVLANAFDCKSVEQARGLPLRSVRGQVTFLPELPGKKLAIGVTGDGYIAPVPTGGYCVGATFQHDDTEATPRIADHAENLCRLESLLPGFANGLSSNRLQGRVGWRTTTPDRLPIFGELQPGLYVATGLGARGLVWAPLGAELLAAKINAEPWPVERELADAVGVDRFSKMIEGVNKEELRR